MKALSCPQHFFQRSRECNSKVNRQMWPELEFVPDLMAVLVISLMMIQSKMKVLSCPQHFLHYKSMEKNFGVQG